MSLINYVHVYPVGDGTVHMQATGDAFPTGYASCNLDTIPEVVKECGPSVEARKSPSMRPGSSSRYLPCILDGEDIVTPEGRVVCSIVQAVHALRGPSPSYGQSQAVEVREQIERTIEEGTRPVQEYDDSDECDEEDEDEELADALASTILAVLKKFKK